MREAYAIYQNCLMALCLAAPFAALAAYGLCRLARSARMAGARRILAAILFAAPAIYLGATKGGHVEINDAYIEDAGSYLTNDIAHIAIAKKTALLPDDTEILVYAREAASTNAADWARLAPYLAYAAHPYDYPLANATNYNVMVAANYTPPPTVHTNGVWVCYAGELWTSADATAYGLPASKIAMREARDYPYAYQVEYLETGGSAYIDLNYVPARDSIVEVSGLFGARPGSSGRRFLASDQNQGVTHYCEISSGWKFGAGSAYTAASLTAGEMYYASMVISGGSRADFSIDIDGTTYTSGTTGWASSTFGSIVLFRINGTYNGAGQRIAQAALTVNGSKVRDVITVVDYDGVACMFDRVTETFFYNVGSGSFIVGPRVN